MAEPTQLTDAQLAELSKKDLVKLLQETASNAFLAEHKLKGAVKNVAKGPKDKFEKAYQELFVQKAFRTASDDAELADQMKAKAAVSEKKKEEKKPEVKESGSSSEVPKKKEKKGYKKSIITKGDKINFPSKGDYVTVRYKGVGSGWGRSSRQSRDAMADGTLDDGTVFDSNMTKKDKPLQFKVGEGKVIRGWDEGIQEMSVGETARLTIQSDWAYGPKGIPGAIPPNATLTFEIVLEGLK